MISTRKITPEDETFFNECLSKDEIHKQLGISFKKVTEENTEAYLISDESGPLMTVRLHNALRVAVQFNPDTPFRSAKASPEVVEWFRELARERGAKEVIARPGGGAVRLLDKLGFEDFDGKYIEVLECEPHEK